MNDFSNDNSDSSIAASSALTKAQDELSKSTGTNNRAHATMMFGAARHSVDSLFDGARPFLLTDKTAVQAKQEQSINNSIFLARADGEGLRAPSTFAKSIEQRLREAGNGDSSGIGTSVPTNQPDKQAVPASPATQPERARLADNTVSEKPDQAAKVSQPIKPTLPTAGKRKEIIISVSPPSELQKPKIEEQSIVKKEQVIAERAKELPERVKVSKVAEMEKAMEKAAKLGAPVVLLFTAEWCGPCQNLKKNVLSKMEGSGAQKVPAIFVHVDTDKAGDGGRSIARAVGVHQGSGIPEMHILAIDSKDAKFHAVGKPIVGGVDYHTLKAAIPKPLSADYVARSRTEVVQNVKQQFERRKPQR